MGNYAPIDYDEDEGIVLDLAFIERLLDGEELEFVSIPDDKGDSKHIKVSLDDVTVDDVKAWLRSKTDG